MSRSDDILNVAAHRLSTGALEQTLTTHPLITEACIIPLPDPLKGQVPFAFIALQTDSESPQPSNSELLKDLNTRIRKDIGAIAALGGLIVGQGIIPRTRSGKTLRRVLREVVELGVKGEWEGRVNVPATVEDPGVVEKARGAVREYFERGEGAKVKAKL